MRTSVCKRSGLLAGMVLLFGTGTEAATLSQTVSVGLQYTNFSQTLLFDRFDPSLGTLTGVAIEVSGQVDRSAFYKNRSVSSGSILTVSDWDASISLSGPSGLSLMIADPFATSTAVGACQDGASACAVSATFGPVYGQQGTDVFRIDNPFLDDGASSGDTNGNVAGNGNGDDWAALVTHALSGSVTAVNLLDFIGSGTVGLDTGAMANVSYSATGGNNTALFRTKAASSVTLTYIYAALVPVPNAVWLLGSALGALGWIRRRSASF